MDGAGALLLNPRGEGSAMVDRPVRAIGIPWYRADDYPRVLAIMKDAHLLLRTHREWQQKAERVERQHQAMGGIVYRAVIDPDQFPGCCAVRGLDVDAQARKRYASEFAMLQVKETH